MEMRRPLVQQREPLAGRSAGLVGDVIRRPRERVDRRDVRTQPCRHEPRRDGKVLVVVVRNVAGTSRTPGLPLDLGARRRDDWRRAPSRRAGPTADSGRRARRLRPGRRRARARRARRGGRPCATGGARRRPAHPPARMKWRSGGSSASSGSIQPSRRVTLSSVTDAFVDARGNLVRRDRPAARQARTDRAAA